MLFKALEDKEAMDAMKEASELSVLVLLEMCLDLEKKIQAKEHQKKITLKPKRQEAAVLLDLFQSFNYTHQPFTDLARKIVDLILKETL